MEIKLVNFHLNSYPANFKLSWGKLGYSRHLFVTLSDGQNLGFGEGVLYRNTFISMIKLLEDELGTLAKGLKTDSYEDTRQSLAKLTDLEPALAFAIDTALYDLEAKSKKTSLAKFLGAKVKKLPIVEEIFIGNSAYITTHLLKILENETKVVKLKVGQNLANDIDNIKLVREKGLEVRLDANRGYTKNQVKSLIEHFDRKEIQIFEEPINEDFESIAKLRKETGIKIMLDESILSLDDLKRAIDLEALDVLNIKLTRVGGITQAKKYIDICQHNGIGVSFGCNEELEIGMGAIISLAASVNNLYGLEGLGTKRLGYTASENDTSVKAGVIDVPAKSGLGVILSFNKVPKISFSMEIGAGFVFKRFWLIKKAFQFLIYEFFGIWETRIENGLLLLLNKVR